MNRSRRAHRQTAEERTQQIIDDAAKYRSARLGSRNLLIRQGRYATHAEWKKRREDHPARLERVRRRLDEGTFG